MDRIETVGIFLSRQRRRRRKLTPKVNVLTPSAQRTRTIIQRYFTSKSHSSREEKWQPRHVSAHATSQAKFILTDFIHWIDVYMPRLPEDGSIAKILTALFSSTYGFSWQNFQKAGARCIQCDVQEINYLWKWKDWDFLGNGKRDDKELFFISDDVFCNINERFKKLFRIKNSNQ